MLVAIMVVIITVGRIILTDTGTVMAIMVTHTETIDITEIATITAEV